MVSLMENRLLRNFTPSTQSLELLFFFRLRNPGNQAFFNLPPGNSVCSHFFQEIPAQWFRGRVSALLLVGCWFEPRPGRTKDYKNATHCLPAWYSGLELGGQITQ